MKYRLSFNSVLLLLFIDCAHKGDVLGQQLKHGGQRATFSTYLPFAM